MKFIKILVLFSCLILSFSLRNKNKLNNKYKNKNKNLHKKIRIEDNSDFDQRYKEMEDHLFQELKDENRHRNKNIYSEYNNNEVEQFSKNLYLNTNLKVPDTFNAELNDFRME